MLNKYQKKLWLNFKIVFKMLAVHCQFVPREDLVQKIMDMGICRNGATKALYWTGRS